MLIESVCTLLRISPDGSSQVLCAHNLSDQTQELHILPAELDLPSRTWRDLLTGEEHHPDKGRLTLTLPPYTIRWLKT